MKGVKSSFDSCSVFLLNATCHLPRPQKATAIVPTVCGRDYGRDVVPLSPAVREANLWNQVAPRVVRPGGSRQAFPWFSTQIDVKKLHEHYVCGAFWKNLMLELQIPSGIAYLTSQKLYHNGTTGMTRERYFLGQILFHGVNPPD